MAPSPQTTSTLAPSFSATSLPSPSNLPLAHGISNGSAFAAVTTLDGTKHIIFQDINSTLRQAVSSSDGGDWEASLSSIIASDLEPLPDARPLTPVIAFLRLSGGPCEEGDQVRSSCCFIPCLDADSSSRFMPSTSPRMKTLHLLPLQSKGGGIP